MSRAARNWMMTEALPSSPIEAPGPNGPLRGTFTGNPTKLQPVVLIIPGSGPTDRNGNNPLGVKANSYRLLSAALADHGIASVRIDKRGMYASADAVPDANAVTVDDYVDDILAWIETIHRYAHTSGIWLLGHSEGGLIALAAATRSPDYIGGLILVATPGRPFGEVLKSQLQANPANAPLLDAAFRAIESLSAGKPVDVNSLPQPLVPLFLPAVQLFLRSIFPLDPTELLRRTSQPVLILQGEQDMQVSVDEAKILRSVQPNATLILLPDTNHVLKHVASADQNENLATYADPFQPLAPRVGEAISNFILNAEHKT